MNWTAAAVAAAAGAERRVAARLEELSCRSFEEHFGRRLGAAARSDFVEGAAGVKKNSPPVAAAEAGARLAFLGSRRSPRFSERVRSIGDRLGWNR